jgi:hypothetical protein
MADQETNAKGRLEVPLDLELERRQSLDTLVPFPTFPPSEARRPNLAGRPPG